MGVQTAGLASQKELSNFIRVAAEAAGYEEGFGVEGCDLMKASWWAAYIRQSLEEQAQNNRIPEYLLTCARMAKDQGVVVPREYILVDHESSEYLDRKYMTYLRKELIAKRRIAGVIFTHQGRLSADPLHQLYFERECAYYGVKFLFGDAPGGTDWASTAGRQLMAQANWLRVKTNRESARAGNIGRVLKGMVPASRAAYGYRYRRDAEITTDGRAHVKKAWWEVNELEPDGTPVPGSPAWVVAQIFSWVGTEGRTLYWVANKLNETSVPAPEGGKWSPSGVSNIVHHNCYTGNHAYNVNARVPNPDRPLGDITAEIKRTLLRPKPRDEWVTFKVPALVSEQLWQKANAGITERGRGKGKQGQSIKALLRNRIYCPRCGRPMVVKRHARQQRTYYYCSKYYRPWAENPCSYNRFVPGSWDDLVWDCVYALLNDDVWLEQQLASEQSQDENMAKLLKLHQYKISQAQSKIARVREGFEGGIYNLDEAKQRIAGCEAAIAKAEQEFKRLQAEMNRYDAGAADIEAVKRQLKGFRDRNLDEASFEDKLDVIVKLGIRVYPSEDLKTMRVTCGLNLQFEHDGEDENAVECRKVMFGSPSRTRTYNLAVNSRPLYH